MPLLYQKFITRSHLQANPQVTFVFGDNMVRVGLGGQAAHMRGEPNAIGIPTKHTPSLRPDAFFDDHDFEAITAKVFEDLTKVAQILTSQRIVVWPTDGIGTGLSELPERAPRIWRWLEDRRHELERL